MRKHEQSGGAGPGTGEAGAVAVAMSGGIDSTLAAALLAEQGREVFGVTAVLTDEDTPFASRRGVRAARAAADAVGIRHVVVDLRDAFARDVIEDFLDAYLSGRTPCPCAVCNARIKFGRLRRKAEALGARRFATGHYAAVRRDDAGGIHLHRGRDAARDQSYFLFGLDPDSLAAALFPLGDWSKARVREQARRRNLPLLDRGESRELCFVAGAHGDWIEARRPGASRPGELVDRQGRVLGLHRGMHRYTVGQRRGLGLAAGHRAYVTALDAPRNRVVLGARRDAMRRRLRVERPHWIAEAPAPGRFRALAQIRYHHAAAACEAERRSDGSLTVVFDEEQFAITPGQAAVLYRGDEVLGGGWIAG